MKLLGFVLASLNGEYHSSRRPIAPHNEIDEDSDGEYNLVPVFRSIGSEGQGSLIVWLRMSAMHVRLQGRGIFKQRNG